jgi:hypothetical protein
VTSSDIKTAVYAVEDSPEASHNRFTRRFFRFFVPLLHFSLSHSPLATVLSETFAPNNNTFVLHSSVLVSHFSFCLATIYVSCTTPRPLSCPSPLFPRSHEFLSLLTGMPKEVQASKHHRNSSSSMATNASTRSASTWSSQDDETLISARASGLNWQPIATKYFPSKTANACRKRHERLMERRNAEDWDGVKLEVLAREYMNVRREMWSILAERVGEKWTIVETKVSFFFSLVLLLMLILPKLVHGKGPEEPSCCQSFRAEEGTR